MFSATYEIVVSRALFCHRLRGKSHEAGKGERFSLARRAVCLFSPVESPVVKVFFILRRRRHHNPMTLLNPLNQPASAGRTFSPL